MTIENIYARMPARFTFCVIPVFFVSLQFWLLTTTLLKRSTSFFRLRDKISFNIFPYTLLSSVFPLLQRTASALLHHLWSHG